MTSVVGASNQPEIEEQEHIYFTSTAGHVFAATSVLAWRLKLPWYGMVSVSLNDTPIKVVADGRTIESHAIAFHARDVQFIATPTHYISIVANPLHEMFRTFTRLEPAVLPLDRALFARFDIQGAKAVNGSLSNPQSAELFDDVLETVRQSLPTDAERDRRGQILVKELWENPQCTLDDLADRLGLSYYRTSHLFTETMGITVRAYQLWQKLYRSNAPLLKGASFTEVAYTADFVDSAHYSRAFQKYYGRTPSRLFRSRRVTIHAAASVSKARAAESPFGS